MTRLKTMLAFLGLSATIASAATSNAAGPLTLGRMWVEQSGVYVGFTSRPADCAGHFYGTYGFINPAHPHYKDMLATLLAAKASGTQVDIWYDVGANTFACNSPSTLLKINAIGLP